VLAYFILKFPWFYRKLSVFSTYWHSIVLVVDSIMDVEIEATMNMDG